MRKVLITAVALAACVSFSAYAQDSSTDTGSTTNAQDAKEMMWEGPVADTFYSDTSARTLRPDSEWSKGWSSLTDEQRAKVKSDCSANTAQPRDEGDTRVCEWAGNN
jgi:Spy/CpxP family protein refolding chaperone